MIAKRTSVAPGLSSALDLSRRAWLAVVLSLIALLSSTVVASAQGQTIYPTDIPGPAGSRAFGKQVVVLANGNIVVADPDYSTPAADRVGAVYLYDGDTLALISVLTGSNADDRVGLGYGTITPGVTALSNGNFVVSSPNWNNSAGAVTWGSGITGVSGTVSAANSLVGGANDLVGSLVVPLSNGNYVVGSAYWDGGSPGEPGLQLGAATWANGATGITGAVTAANSLVGGEGKSYVGDRVTLLSNGNFLVRSLYKDKGAVTWGSAAAGLPTGSLSSANSLVGSKIGDRIGSGGPPDYEGVVPLSNGNYVVVSVFWDNGAATDAGAVTWGNGATGTTSVVSSANSLVGARTGDNVGYGGNTLGVVPLANGNYVVASYIWDSPSASDVGAITWANGATGRSGLVSSLNSLIGASPYDYVGFIPGCYCSGVTALGNGNYVVSSPHWDNGAISDAGAVTWVNGATGLAGAVSTANSLVGAESGSAVGRVSAMALPNGNYLVRSPNWSSGRGAVTWANGATGITGVVSAANSLVGASGSDSIGTVSTHAPRLGVTILSNGNYVISSPYWGGSRGAVTWGNGATGVSGEVSATNSLIGNSLGDRLGMLREESWTGVPVPLDGVIPLSNGNYVVGGAFWDNGALADAGIVTLASGATGATGDISAANSLVGSSANDRIGRGGVAALSNGNFVVASPTWDDGGPGQHDELPGSE